VGPIRASDDDASGGTEIGPGDHLSSSNRSRFAPLVTLPKGSSGVQPPTNWRAVVISEKSSSCSKPMRFQKTNKVQRFEMKVTIAPESSDWPNGLSNVAALMLPNFYV
jgi:hypothetical protein